MGRRVGPPLWEILVPTTKANGVRIGVKFHQRWDAKVQALCGGMTILPPARGTWFHEGVAYRERMIPVRFRATPQQVERIVEMTLDHYKDEKAIMAYKISDDIVLRFR